MQNRRATAYICLLIAVGGAIFCDGISNWNHPDWPRFLTYCILSIVASGMKVVLPGITGTLSLLFLFVLISVSDLNLAATLLVGCLGMLAQCLFHTQARPRLVQVVFSVASFACAIKACDAAYNLSARTGLFEDPMRLLAAAGAFFLTNTLSIAVVIALTEGKPVWLVWRNSYLWTFPNYLMGAAVAWGAGIVRHAFGWQASLLLLPVLYVMYRSHSVYVGRLEDAKKRAEAENAYALEVAALQRRTIEILALAIEAKDQTTHDHLQRVELYAIEVGKDLGLSDVDLEALRAAALLHDVGKIAVPEYIISKPGKLTPDEFEKMKTHTIVGAEIVEQIRFPYAVAPNVRSHHEKWDGSGYPDGLAGESIPIGARILSAVDCLDALASDRQYRRALPLEDAIQVITSEAGKSFDPKVVEVLSRRYIELERMARAGRRTETTKFSTDIKIARGKAPAAGFEQTMPSAAASLDLANFHNSISEAETHARVLADFTYRMDRCQDRTAIFQVLRESLRKLVPYDVMVVYLRRENHLIPEGLDGESYRLFASLEIPVGMGLSGWVAENGKPIINGNPSVEPGYLNDPTKFSVLRSALAVPLEVEEGIIGVLSLYRRERDAFGPEHLKMLNAFALTLARFLHSAADRTSVQL